MPRKPKPFTVDPAMPKPLTAWRVAQTLGISRAEYWRIKAWIAKRGKRHAT